MYDLIQDFYYNTETTCQVFPGHLIALQNDSRNQLHESYNFFSSHECLFDRLKRYRVFRSFSLLLLPIPSRIGESRNSSSMASQGHPVLSHASS